MARWTGPVAGLALVTAAAGVWLGMRALHEARTTGAAARALPAGGPDATAGALAHLEERVRELEARVEEGRVASDALRDRLEAVATAAVGGRGGAADGAPAPADPRPADPSAARRLDPAEKQEWRDLLEKVLGGGGATAEEQERFWKLVRSDGFADELLADLEAVVAANPTDIAARMELTSGYYTKLFTVPPGPQMGTWAAKAEEQLKEVLKLDDTHWEARNSLATSYSRYPEFLNKTPDAIHEFEILRRQQEAGAPAAEQSGVYLNLGLLYIRQNNKEKAREALEAGVRRHPEAENLRKTLATLDP